MLFSRLFFRLLVSGYLTISTVGYSLAQPRPHIFILLADDLGYGDLGFTGNPVIKTPHLDTLAAHARRLTFYAGGPICSPSRIALLTGRVPQAVGIAHNIQTGSLDPNMYTLNAAEATLPHTLANAGYRCLHTGKWHLTPLKTSSVVQSLGFHDSHSGNLNGNNNAWNVVTKAKEQLTLSLNTHPDKPVFHYICFNEPHNPYRDRLLPNISIIQELGYHTLTDYPICSYDTPPLATTASDYIDSVKLYCGTVSNLDRAIGHFLGFLDSLGIRDSSIIMFFSDNGPAPYGYGTAGCNLAGTKYKLQNGGLRVPALVHWKGRWDDGAEAPGASSMVDIMPTLCDLVGAPLINSGQLHGENVAPLWDNLTTHRQKPLYWFFIAARRRNIFAGMYDNRRYHQVLIDTTGRYKLARTLECWPDTHTVSLPVYHRFGAVGVRTDEIALYDLLLDPLETNNIAGSQPAITEALVRTAHVMDKTIRRQAPLYNIKSDYYINSLSCSGSPPVPDTAAIACPQWPVVVEIGNPLPDLSTLVSFHTNNSACGLWQVPPIGATGMPPFADVHAVCLNNHAGHCRIYLNYNSILDSPSKPFKFQLVPNPTHTFFFAQTSELTTFELEVFNLTGLRIYNDRQYKPFYEVDVTSWPAGTYVVRLTNSRNESVSRCLIIVR